MAQGPWGGGGGKNGGDGGDDREPQRGPQRPWGQQGGEDPGREPPRRPGQRPGELEIEELMKKGQDRLRVLMGGRGNGNGGRRGPGGPGRPQGPQIPMDRRTIGLGVLAIAAVWVFMSFYRVETNERSVELLFGRAVSVGTEGLNFAPWPVVTAEVIKVTDERVTEIGTGRGGPTDNGLMLTRDQNIVDMEYQVVWNISDPAQFLFNLADPDGTIRAVAESAMRDIIARSELAPILNRDRGAIAEDLREAVQATLNSYQSGINVVRVNLDRADPPGEVIDSFREVQAAQQERDRLEKEADAYANRVLANARGEAAALVEQAEAYRAQAVNDAQGEASRFIAVYAEYARAPEVTRKRMYLETMERVLGSVDKVLLDGDANQGVVPYLPLDQLRRPGDEAAQGATGGVGGQPTASTGALPTTVANPQQPVAAAPQATGTAGTTQIGGTN